MTNLLIVAYNIHSGGGKTLLEQLINAIPDDISATIYIDKRLKTINTNANLRLIKIWPSIFHRIMAEFKIYKSSSSYESILHFGNLPPLFSSKCPNTSVYLQNKYLISNCNLHNINLKTKLRITIERKWFKWRKNSSLKYIVQTESMKIALKKYFQDKRYSVETNGFYNIINYPKITRDDNTSEYSFIYVASGELHKNHKNLIKAWIHLSNESYFPKLTLILGKEYLDLILWIEQQTKKFNLNIEIVNEVPHSTLIQLYLKHSALIFPSLFESFGLPLVEAHLLNIPVIAAEKDYVRDTINPIQSFDPTSSVSITSAVKRFMGIESKNKIMSPTEFLNKFNIHYSNNSQKA